jgi:hypothetical protein
VRACVPTTINNSYDFGVGRLLGNLPKLRKIGFAANRRMLELEKASHDCRIGAQTFEALQSPATTVEGQRASALRFGDARVQGLFAVLLLLCLQLEGFRNRQLRSGLSPGSSPRNATRTGRSKKTMPSQRLWLCV